MEKVSVIIPVYNASKVIERCLYSIINQTYSNLEIICINDGSTDNSYEKLKQFANKDKRVKIINKKNTGVSSARNSGLDISTGEYILFVDSDDYLETNTIEKLIHIITYEKSDLVIFNYKIKYNNKIIKNKFKLKNISVNKNEFLKNLNKYCKKAFINQPWNKLYIKSKISKRFNENLDLGEDLEFNIKYFSEVKKVSLLNEFLYIYDVTIENSLTKVKENSLKELLDLYIEMYMCLYYNKGLKTSMAMDFYILKASVYHVNRMYNKEKSIFKKISKMLFQYKYIEKFYKKILSYSKIDMIQKKIIFSNIMFGILVFPYVLFK